MVKDSSFNPLQDPDEKYRNEDYIMAKLVERNQEELKKIKSIHNLSDEQVELFCDFAGLRHKTLAEMKLKLVERQAINPKASQSELDLGAYIEQIEPQVREAVMQLRQKGYTTYESGFSDFDSQKIGFEEEHLKDFIVPESLKKDLEKDRAKLIIKPRSIEIKFSDFYDLEKIKTLWQKVVNELPSLGTTARPNNIKSAQTFRKKQL